MIVVILAIFTYTKFMAFCIGQQDEAKLGRGHSYNLVTEHILGGQVKPKIVVFY